MIFNRIASALIAAVYITIGLVIRDRDAGDTVTFILATILPIPFIWFSDALGDYTGPAHFGYVNRPTIGVMIAVTGWVLLITLPLALILLGA